MTIPTPQKKYSVNSGELYNWLKSTYRHFNLDFAGGMEKVTLLFNGPTITAEYQNERIIWSLPKWEAMK